MIWVCPWGSRGGAGGHEEVLRDQCPPSPSSHTHLETWAGVLQQEMPRIIHLILLLRKLQKPQGSPGSQVGFLGMLGAGKGMGSAGLWGTSLRGWLWWAEWQGLLRAGPETW